MNAVTWTLLTVAAALLGAELLAWCTPLHRLLLRRAAASLPEADRDRYIEEWSYELEETPAGPLTRLVFVTSLFLRRRRLAGELGPSSTAASDEELAERFLDTQAIMVASRLMKDGPSRRRLRDGDVQPIWDEARRCLGNAHSVDVDIVSVRVLDYLGLDLVERTPRPAPKRLP